MPFEPTIQFKDFTLVEKQNGLKFVNQKTGKEYTFGSGGLLSSPSIDVDSVSTKKYAPPGATAADIQSLIDSVAADVSDGNIGVVYGRSDTVYTIDQSLILPSNVYLRDFHLKVANGANVTAVKSEGFDTLTGTNSWFVDTEGVRHSLGLINVHIDGNKANNTSGAGIEFYAKRVTIENVVVRNCAGVGIYSECGTGGGQHDWRDLPESVIGPVFVRKCGSHGIQYRGPHDGTIPWAVCAMNGGQGILTEESATYKGNNLQIGWMHNYGNAGNRFDVAVFVNEYTIDGDGLVANGPFRANRVGSMANAPTLELNGTAHIGTALINGVKGANLATGVTITGTGTTIGQLIAGGWDQDGVVIDANRVSIGRIEASNCGGYGVKIGDTVNVSSCDLNIGDVNNAGTAGVFYRGGTYNSVKIQSFIGSTSTGLDLTTGSLPDPTDSFEFQFSGSGSNIGNTAEYGTASFSGDGVVTTFTVPHSLISAPDNVIVTPQSADASGDSYVTNITATSFDVVFGTAPATGTNNVSIAYKAAIAGAS